MHLKRCVMNAVEQAMIGTTMPKANLAGNAMEPDTLPPMKERQSSNSLLTIRGIFSNLLKVWFP